MASPSQAPELSRNSANIATSRPAVTAASAVVTKHRRCGSESLVWDMQAAGGWRPPAAAAAACEANSRGSAETARQPDSPRLSTRLSSGQGCPSVEFSVRPRSASLSARGGQGPGQGPEGEVSPFTPTIVGYEVTEERAKFTVYKVRVERNAHDSWIVFRRYADFVRLHDKLRESFPELRMELPPKRWLRDNFHPGFLEVRQRGLQAYLYSVALNSRAARSAAVREFLCLDEPPGPFDSLEESRAFCESLEEANARLQRSLLERERELASWRQECEELRAALEATQARVRVLEDTRRVIRGGQQTDGGAETFAKRRVRGTCTPCHQSHGMEQPTHRHSRIGARVFQKTTGNARVYHISSVDLYSALGVCTCQCGIIEAIQIIVDMVWRV